MNKIFSGIYKFCLNAIKIISIVVSICLVISAYLFSTYATNMEAQVAEIHFDNILLNILGILVFALVLWAFRKIALKNIDLLLKVMLLFDTLWILILGFVLIVFGRTIPAADAWSVYDIAREIANGNMSVIHSAESYISYYPQQIGLVLFYEVIIRVINIFKISVQQFHFIKIIYVILTVLTVFVQYKIIGCFKNRMAKNNQATYLLFAAMFLPMIMYSSFVYSEVPSFTALSTGILLLIRWFVAIEEKENSLAKEIIVLLFSSVLIAVSVALRKNNLIAVIAISIVVILEILKLISINRKKAMIELTVYLVVMLFLSLSILGWIKALYEHRSGNSISSGVTATSYFAMGMQESGRGYGWYNGFNFVTYQEAGMDSELANKISKEAIAERRAYFKENPSYAFNFYKEKFLTQWTDGTYASRQATLAEYGGRTDLIKSLYEGKLAVIYWSYCNLLQLCIYIGVAIFSIRSVMKKYETTSLVAYIGYITVLGGLIFHMLWEANSRYIYLYGLMLIPYAATILGMRKMDSEN